MRSTNLFRALLVCICAGSFTQGVVAQSSPANRLQVEAVRNIEKAFMEMAQQKSIAEAFAWFADTAAVIRRGQPEVLIRGKKDILKYYQDSPLNKATVSWAPDFIDVSTGGDLAYSYGHYVWTVKDDKGRASEFKGIYLTIWKKQQDGSWKYVWD